MKVNTKHPNFEYYLADWEACRDTYRGETAVKRRNKGHRYLPPTTGMWLDGMQNDQQQGWKNYRAYLTRALLAPFVQDAVDMLLGMLWHRVGTIELGPLEATWGKDRPATPNGQTLMQLWRRIHVQQLVTGRVGALIDLPGQTLAKPQPYVELYNSEKIINWDEGSVELRKNALNLVVLDESTQVRDVFEWKPVDIYRVLFLGDLRANEPAGEYRAAVVRSDDSDGLEMSPERVEQLVGGATGPNIYKRGLQEIPFVFIGSKALGAEIDDPPLLGLVRSVLALFRMDADYRQFLHMQGQDTLVTIGAEDGEVTSLGAGAHINLSNPKADAKMIGVDSKGLEEMRAAIENDRAMAAKKAGELLSDNSKARESGDALTQRVGARSASLKQIAQVAAEGLQEVLRITARWMGHGEGVVEKIIVTPNEEFAQRSIDTKSIKELVETYLLGGPITLEQIYRYQMSQGLTDVPWEDFIAAKRTEAEALSDLMPSGPTEGDEEEDDDQDEGAGGNGDE